MTDPVPPRVLAAEQRREFAELMARSSLGCPNRACEHGIGWHDADAFGSDGTPEKPICAAPGCACGEQWRGQG